MLGETRPCAITTSRSQISNSSSSSSLTTSTAQPSSRSFSSAPRICAAAPTSTPQVGCETISSVGPASISRPTMNFCRLPPDRLLAAAPGPPHLTWYFAISASASARTWRVRTQPAALTARVRVSKVFAASDSVGTAPRPRRSSGTKCRPARRRRPGGWSPIGLPNSRMASGAARGSSPESAAISSCCPLPETPAMPTISPARTSKRMPRRFMPNCSCRASVRSRTSSTTAPSRA